MCVWGGGLEGHRNGVDGSLPLSLHRCRARDRSIAGKGQLAHCHSEPPASQLASWPVISTKASPGPPDRGATRRTYGVDFHGEIGLCPFYVDADGVRHIAGPELVFLLGFAFPLPLGSVRGGGAGGGEKKSLLVMMLDVRWGVYLWERTRPSGVVTTRRSYICQIGINTEKISMAPAQG